MKIISVEELHRHTAQYVRATGDGPILIEENGAKVAILDAAPGVRRIGKRFPVRDISSLPKAATPTSDLILKDRDGQ